MTKYCRNITMYLSPASSVCQPFVIFRNKVNASSNDQLIVSDRCLGNPIASLDFLGDSAAAADADIAAITGYRSTHCDASLHPTSSYRSSWRRTQMSFDGHRVHPPVDPEPWRLSLGALRFASNCTGRRTRENSDNFDESSSSVEGLPSTTDDVILSARVLYSTLQLVDDWVWQSSENAINITVRMLRQERSFSINIIRQ